MKTQKTINKVMSKVGKVIVKEVTAQGNEEFKCPAGWVFGADNEVFDDDECSHCLYEDECDDECQNREAVKKVDKFIQKLASERSDGDELTLIKTEMIMQALQKHLTIRVPYLQALIARQQEE
jgi:hypothetical protein